MVWMIIEATVAMMMMMLKPRHQLLPRGDKGRRSLLGASADLLKHHSSSMALPRNLKNNENFSASRKPDYANQQGCEKMSKLSNKVQAHHVFINPQSQFDIFIVFSSRLHESSCIISLVSGLYSFREVRNTQIALAILFTRNKRANKRSNLFWFNIQKKIKWFPFHKRKKSFNNLIHFKTRHRIASSPWDSVLAPCCSA